MFETEKDFWKSLERLNALSGEYWIWQACTATKSHEDIFNVPIKPREVYFKKPYGIGWHEVLKVSRTSMDIMLNAVVESSETTKQLADFLIDKKHARQADIFKRLDNGSDD